MLRFISFCHDVRLAGASGGGGTRNDLRLALKAYALDSIRPISLLVRVDGWVVWGVG